MILDQITCLVQPFLILCLSWVYSLLNFLCNCIQNLFVSIFLSLLQEQIWLCFGVYFPILGSILGAVLKTVRTWWSHEWPSTSLCQKQSTHGSHLVKTEFSFIHGSLEQCVFLWIFTKRVLKSETVLLRFGAKGNNPWINGGCRVLNISRYSVSNIRV